MYSDSHLNSCALVFETLGIYERGIDFERFIGAPDYYLALCKTYRPLLPRQLAVQARQDAIEELQEIETILTIDLDRNPDVKRSNGTIVESLHHTAWPRKPRRRDVCL